MSKRVRKVRSIYGGTTYEVRPLWGCVGLFAITEHIVSDVADYYYQSMSDVLADEFKEVV